MIMYRSTDAGAPTLAGNTLGGLITVLDAALVDGYGSKPAAGWTHSFATSGNVAVYRPGMASTARMFYRVDDNGSFAAGGREAAIRGYETMSDLNTGTGDFPTVVQQTNGLQLGKTEENNTNTKAWFISADAKTCIFGVFLDTVSRWQIHYFGEFKTFTPGDAYNAVIVAGGVGAVPDGYLQNNFTMNFITKTNVTNGEWSTGGTKYITRSHDQLGSSVASQLTPDSDICLNYAGRSSTPTYQPGWGFLPKLNPADGGVYMCSFMLAYPTTAVRGKLRGLWVVMHDTREWAENEAFNGTGPLVGRTFEIKKITLPGGLHPNACLAAVETSNTAD